MNHKRERNEEVFAPVLRAVAALLKEMRPAVMAIDGRSGAGKSTLARLLAEHFRGAVVPMDDFFLPPDLRMPERYREPGGNVHYERFLTEAAPGLREKTGFSYRAFDCGAMAYGVRKTVEPAPLFIVEGAYSLRPEFRPLYGLAVFMDISKDRQRARLIEREGADGARAFEAQWLPLEEAYITALRVKEHCDIVVEA